MATLLGGRATNADLLQARGEDATLGSAQEDAAMFEKSMDQECETPLDQLEAWGEAEEDEIAGDGMVGAIPTIICAPIRDCVLVERPGPGA